MAAIQILLLRHAEKPDEIGQPPGLTQEGGEDPKSLTIRGWQRAGALAALLAPNPLTQLRLPCPDRIYASAFRAGGGHSRRPEQTVQPLAQRLNRAVDLSWALHPETQFAATSANEAGTALVCWQHQGIAALARAIAALRQVAGLASDWNWPADRYDVIWYLRRDEPGQPWHFTQHCQGLLAGDSDRPFGLRDEA